jgi:voltage-gated potassium channel
MSAQPGPPADPQARFGKPERGWRREVYEVIFEAETHAGRLFDMVLVFVILASVMVVLLDSVQLVRMRNGRVLDALEWIFTAVFTLEYLARVCSVRHPLRYMLSFFGVIDLLSVLPSYIGLLVPGTEVLLDIRILRLLRVFRVFKLTAYVEEYGLLGRAIVASRRKITIFLSVVMMLVLVMGTIMYIVEGPEHGFTSIPTSVYWAITAVTTVGFGDLVPKTDIGRTIASLMMLTGWGILAVPTGIISSEMTAQRFIYQLPPRRCRACGSGAHAADSRYCKDCGASLEPPPKDGAGKAATGG